MEHRQQSIGSRHLWKLSTFTLGLLALLAGAYTRFWQDWDAGVSVVMAVCTLLTAELAVGAFLDRKWGMMPLAILAAWVSVDGSYWAYWSLVNPAVAIRQGQWPMSLCLYLLAGMVWRVGPPWEWRKG